ncbi:diguanylate cyclase (GGDEF) domain-containing protein [Proteiniborus ethanoligenes]|uniref:Stage 0 sporulation protein A homolog n=1 Tax=Proteiniborus ethanoligenes TaxID=415015 RepID=A0A1H3MAJ2_9FIRM|nr:diguanylate cyclase [Proteiniborus ethanoligenes]SDY73606.1 diguanylate cyclase (GGDEF) domain-containing protein [Proteiniborus ethanoligenes]
MEAIKIPIEQLTMKRNKQLSALTKDHLQGNAGEQDKLSYKGRILILDDDVMMLNILERLLTERGHEVILSSNPFEVISIIKENKIDLAILDLILPKSNGYEITALIRKTEPELPIIMLSGSAITESKIKALKIGADDYITKPFEENELIARVERTLTRYISLKALSVEDGLTGAYTKTYLWRKLKEIKNAYTRNGKIFSVAFVDIDCFKEINDTYGHLAGDEALKCFVSTLKSSLRATDYVFRFGGDEFIVLFPETTKENAHKVLERFRDNESYIQCIKSKTGVLIGCSFSAGITEIKGVSDTVEKIIERADEALYQAKAQGKNRVIIYDSCD